MPRLVWSGQTGETDRLRRTTGSRCSTRNTVGRRQVWSGPSAGTRSVKRTWGEDRRWPGARTRNICRGACWKRPTATSVTRSRASRREGVVDGSQKKNR
jgi:hypothetical protein